MERSDIKISETKSPSYLYSILNTVDDIVLIHKVYNPPTDGSFDLPTPTKNKDDDSFFDITGSPLKVNLNTSSILSTDSINYRMNLWQKNEENHCPLPYHPAQKYIQEYINQNKKREKKLPAWWVLDGSDDKRTVLLSALQVPDYFTTTLVKIQGYLPKNHPTITFDALCNKHFEIVGDLTGEKQKIPLRQLSTSISKTYELFGSKLSAIDFDDKCNTQGSVYLDISWNKCCAEIPLDHSKSILTVQTVVGQENSALSRFWKELVLLELYLKALYEYNSQTMLNNHWLPSQATDNDSNLIDRIIETIHISQNFSKRNIDKEDGNDLHKIIENIDNRHTCDITDQLWTILNQCSTYGDLTECLNIVFTEIMNSESSVYIADSNMTSMAVIIRDIVAGKTSVFKLKGTQPIEMLIDIGLEKLRKDFSYIFTRFGIITEQDLRDVFNTPGNQSTQNTLNKNKSKHIRAALYHQKSILNQDEVMSRMKVLGQLHRVLETLILVPSFWQILSLKTIYDHYTGNESPIDSFSELAQNKLFEIQVELPTTKVYEYITKLSPIMWKLSLTLSKPSVSVKNVFHLSQNSIFPPVMYSPDIMDATLGDGDQVYYHYTLLTQLTNFIKSTIF